MAGALGDLVDVCNALQTAQCAMAADSACKPAYLEALALIEASLRHAAASAESGLSAVQAVGAAGLSAVVAGGGPARQAASSLEAPSQQQRVQSLLLARHDAAAAANVTLSAERLCSSGLAGGWGAAGADVTAEAAAAALPCQQEGQAPADSCAPPASSPTPQQFERAGLAEGLPAELQPEARQCSPAARSSDAPVAPTAGAAGAAAGQHGQAPSTYLQAFRAQHGQPQGTASLRLLQQQLGGKAGQAAPAGLRQIQLTADCTQLPSPAGKPSASAAGMAPAPACAAGPAPKPLLPSERRVPAASLGEGGSTAESLAAVIMALEDELSTLDLRQGTVRTADCFCGAPMAKV